MPARSKTLLCIAACFATLGAPVLPAFAAPVNPQSSSRGQHAPLSPEEEMQHLTEALRLSPEQQARIKPILINRRAQLTTIQADRNLSPEGKSVKMKSLDEDANNRLFAVLNGEQKEKYRAMVQQRKEQLAQQRAHRDGTPQQ